ncbi:MAG TPA: hypothetical protein VGD71_12190 [Kribbella sp.]
MSPTNSVLDAAPNSGVDPDEFIRAAMAWHFGPTTGSPYWLKRSKSFDFDPIKDVHCFADLALFPNVVDELRHVTPEEMIPRGYGSSAKVVGFFESGGTTGIPKRVLFLDDWVRTMVDYMHESIARAALPDKANWLGIVPTGPHVIGEQFRRVCNSNGGVFFSVDMDPRWVKKLVGAGKTEDAEDYANHIVEQAGNVLRSQEIGILATTPPLLERLSRREDLVSLINRNVRGILWSGTHMDPDTYDILAGDVFPNVSLSGVYGSTLILGGVHQRVGASAERRCIFDGASPFISFRVIDPQSGESVAYGERGQVVMNHISRSALLPNNLERDSAIRLPAPKGVMGDAVAQVSPVESFEGQAVIEGVY